ncbi:spermidine synthase [Salininema proteolyticum]|uniref:Spermidine synthase n=1 Tax=Salininema proteolyticum TaxID=1607685 RepID=A0ABV8U3E3_9ACTN
MTASEGEAGRPRFERDRDRPELAHLIMDGVVQATIDTEDPKVLDADYMRRISYFIDASAPSGRPIRALHLGGGALALARYVAAARPRSYQQAVEPNREVIDLVRADAPLPKGVKVKMRCGDAREELEKAPEDCYDFIITDVFQDARIPGHVATREFVGEVARVLRPGGLYAANLCDGGRRTFARSALSAVRAEFAHALIAAPGAVLRGGTFGNILVLASAAPLPIEDVRRRFATDPFPCRLVEGAELDDFIAGARALSDEAAMDSPVPPKGAFR